jgi:molybdopterin/thiamine biosynthesis adenylyltransferase
MLGATATGSETLKNLILPQIKKFTIVDNSLVTLQDCGQNFFLTDEEIG